MLSLRLSVIIPVRDGGAAFSRCLASLRAQTEPPWEVIVVDDGSCDGSAAEAEAAGAHVLRQRKSQGPAHARNAGAAIADGDVLVFFDADVELHPKTLQRVRRRLESEPGLDGLSGRYDDDPPHRTLVSRYRNLLHAFTHLRAAGRAATFWAGCGALRRAVFAEAGGFDTRFGTPSVEDLELGMRLARSGRRLEIDASLQVKHHKRWTLWSMIRTDVWQRAVPWAHLVMAQRRAPAALNLRWSQRASVAAVCLAVPALAFHPAVSVALLLFHGALNLPLLRHLRATQGIGFTLGAWPLHALHHFYSGVAIPLALMTYPWRRLSRPERALSEAAR